MTALKFVTAYEQLQPSEVEFVDGFVRYLEREAEPRFERLTNTLARAQSNIVVDDLDDRTRDLFAKPLVLAAIRERVEFLANERDLTPARIIKEHAALALANMQDYLTVGEDGFPTPDFSGLTRTQWAAVQEVETIEEFGKFGSKKRIKFKLANKQNSLDALAKWNGLDKADNAENLAYRALSNQNVDMPATLSTEELAGKYAEFIE